MSPIIRTNLASEFQLHCGETPQGKSGRAFEKRSKTEVGYKKKELYTEFTQVKQLVEDVFAKNKGSMQPIAGKNVQFSLIHMFYRHLYGQYN